MGKDCLRNLSIGYGCREREHLGILLYNGRYTMYTGKILCIRVTLVKSCEAGDKGCSVFEGQITAPPTVAVLGTATKVIFCPLV